jgi:ABC-type multidrug transport system fused ATPase/permease subunit
MYIKPDKTSGILLFIVAIIARLTAMVDFLIIAKIIDIVVKILQNHSTIESVIPYLVFLACFNFISSLLARVR